jgi:hypothetical protein
MIQLPDLPISDANVDSLIALQNSVNELPDFASQSAQIAQIWKTKPVRAFNEIKQVLMEMIPGTERCHYCEDSKGDEIEHIFPKTFYPEKSFIWENLCLSCGPCNNRKSSKFAVFAPNSNQKTLVLPFKKGQTRIQPIKGTPIFINPRIENPLDFLFLDLNISSEFGFHFTPFVDNKNSIEWEKGNYTAENLGLNNRAYLVKARRKAYRGYRASLREYISERNTGAQTEDLDDIKLNFSEGDHKTVWLEMKRQQHTIPELTSLFDAAPEALNWQ